MAAVVYTKEDWKVEADIQRLPSGKYQGVVLVMRRNQPASDEPPRTVDSVSEGPEEALEEAKALAHRIMSEL